MLTPYEAVEKAVGEGKITAEEILKIEKEKTQKKTERLVHLIMEEIGAELFSDQFREAFIFVGNKIIKIRSKSFRKWLSYLAWSKTEEAVSSDVVQSVIGVLEGQCLYGENAKQHCLFVRVATWEGSIWYDLGNSKAVRIDENGWEVITNPPIIFRALAHQKDQVLPVKDGNIMKLLKFINIPEQEKGKLSDEQLLFLTSLVSKFIPGFPHPIDLFHGSQGSAKTTIAKIVKDLVDPSAIEILSPTDDPREFIQLASHHWLISFDNLSRVSAQLSDALCRTITGSGFSKRELYSDDDDIIYNFQHTITINGINLAAERGDLLDRSLIIELQRLKFFRDEKKFWRDFEKVKPEILGAIFDLVSSALKHIWKVPSCEGLRLQDFARYGCAITRAIGYTDENFLMAYKKNILLGHEEAISASPVGLAIQRLMADRVEWSGTPTEALSVFNIIAMDRDFTVDTKSKMWPKDPRWLWRRIQEVRTNLEAKGIRVWKDREGEAREIHIETLTMPKKEENDVMLSL